MSPGNQHPGSTPSSAVVVDPRNPARSLRRDVAVAIVLVTLLLTGITVGAMRATHEAEPTAAALTGAEPSEAAEQFVYFPSQYVNQGVEIPEPAPTF